jgi:hypothetical protein
MRALSTGFPRKKNLLYETRSGWALILRTGFLFELSNRCYAKRKFLKRLLRNQFMIKTFVSLGTLLACFLLGMGSISAQSNGQVIFNECAQQIRIMEARCNEHMEGVAGRASNRIDELLAAGQRERARAVANDAIETIRNSSRRCLENMTQVCQRCVSALRQMGEHRLAQNLETLCTEARRRVANKANTLAARLRAKF